MQHQAASVRATGLPGTVAPVPDLLQLLRICNMHVCLLNVEKHVYEVFAAFAVARDSYDLDALNQVGMFHTVLECFSPHAHPVLLQPKCQVFKHGFSAALTCAAVYLSSLCKLLVKTCVIFAEALTTLSCRCAPSRSGVETVLMTHCHGCINVSAYHVCIQCHDTLSTE